MGSRLSSAQNNVESSPPDAAQLESQELTWWCKLLIKALAAVAAIIAIITGVFTCISLSICIFAGIFQILLALLVLVFELPFCCAFVEITKPIANFAERRKFLEKAFIYCGLAIPPFAMCWGLSTLFGCGAVFAVGVFYGLLALGKKADRSTMMARAAQDSTVVTNDKVDLVPYDQLALPSYDQVSRPS